MSDADFRAVIDSLAARRPGPVAPAEALTSVAVLGAGAIGRLLACEALAAGLDVRLHSVSGRELDELRTAGAITVRGAHLVGSYAVGESSERRPSIRLASSVDEAIAGVDAVLVATPAVAHATYAGVLAGSLTDGQLVVLVPGRFLGSVVVRRELIAHHCPADVTIAELSAAPYVATREGARLTVHGVTRAISVGSLPARASADVAARLGAVLPGLVPVDSPLDTAFAGVTGVLGVAPLLTNAAAVEAREPVLLKSLVPPGLSGTLLRQLDDERLDVAFHYGVRDLPSAAGWLRTAYGDPARDVDEGPATDLGEVLEEIEMFDDVTVAGTGGQGGPHVTDDVPHTLVPLAHAGRAAGVPTPATDTVIALASCLVGVDLRTAGRSLDSLGLGDVRPADARRALTTATDERPRATTWWSV